MNTELEGAFAQYGQRKKLVHVIGNEKAVIIATIDSIIKPRNRQEYHDYNARDEDGRRFVCRLNEHHAELKPFFDANLSRSVYVWGKRGAHDYDPGVAKFHVDGVQLIDDAAPAIQPSSEERSNHKKIGLGSRAEWLFFVMESKKLPPGIVLWPQYRFRIDGREYRVDFAMVDSINCEIIGLIEIDGKQHKESVVEDRLRQHAIEKHSGVKIDRIDTETIRAMARSEGLL